MAGATTTCVTPDGAFERDGPVDTQRIFGLEPARVIIAIDSQPSSVRGAGQLVSDLEFELGRLGSSSALSSALAGLIRMWNDASIADNSIAPTGWPLDAFDGELLLCFACPANIQDALLSFPEVPNIIVRGVVFSFGAGLGCNFTRVGATDPIHPAPEPAPCVLLAAGLIGFLLAWCYKRVGSRRAYDILAFAVKGGIRNHASWRVHPAAVAVPAREGLREAQDAPDPYR